jgi:hypothetical protein
LHLLGFFNNPNRSFLLGEIGARKLPGKSFAVAGQGIQDTVDIFGRVIDQDIDILSEADVALDRDRYSADDDESNPGFDSDEGYLKWRANSRIDWAWRGFDLITTVHYLDGFHEVLDRTIFSGVPYPNGKKEHYVKQTWFFDVQASYDFTFVAPVETQPVAGYAKDAHATTLASDGNPKESPSMQAANFGLPIWKRLLDHTTLTIGCNDVFGQDPPHASTSTNYADFLYDSTGRFVYFSLTKKF